MKKRNCYHASHSGGYGARETILNQCFNIANCVRKGPSQIDEAFAADAQLFYSNMPID